MVPVRGDQFDGSEVQSALKSLSTGKAAGNDGIPSDLWKLLLKSKDAVQELLKLCQACWSEKELPETWRTAKVVMLYKKGDNSLPQNYRPISLLPVGYKILAWMIQKRLQTGGAESRIRKS